MLVVVIIGILVAIAFPIFNKTIEKSREKLALANLKLILAGEKLYRLSYDHYYPNPSIKATAELDEINKMLNLDIEPKYFTYKVETEPANKYNFKIYAVDKKTNKKVYVIDPEGNVSSVK